MADGAGGQDAAAEWDAEAAKWDSEPAVALYADKAHASLISIASRVGVSLGGARVCDFGCGTGQMTQRLVEGAAHVDAVDISPKMLDVLRQKAERCGWSDKVTISRELPDPSDVGRVYDTVVASSVCSFLPDYPGTVARIAGLLRPGGLFVQWDWEATDGSGGGGDGSLSKDEIRRAIEAAGIKCVAIERAFDMDFEHEGKKQAHPILVGVGQAPK